MPQKCVGDWSSVPGPTMGADSAPPDLLAGFQGGTLWRAGKEKEGKEQVGEEGDKNGRKKEVRRKGEAEKGREDGEESGEDKECTVTQ